ncbi:hypothetical protein BV22DRAFT_1029575 [Leucogyrophana mollusca]|uniref:Uncharacterized protein n=1 Tax=Leucogyrophana mollusca TaxID=85980 RepID=A0ACB8BUL3_9AGAM|nr:hypothetical protein BV22DRAFT_1029575 [Leucogyrophana mollusca]
MDVVNRFQSNILVDQDGRPLNIFIQVDGLNNRRKLLRTLREAGALVNPVAANAQILLVDSSTTEGKQILRSNNADSRRIVLEYSWAYKSLQAGKPLLAHDNWGGALPIDDGLPIEGAEEDEVEQVVSKSPLPTPRVTPIESTHGRRTDSPALGPPTIHAQTTTRAPEPHQQSPMHVIPRQVPQNFAIPPFAQLPQPTQPSGSSAPATYPPQQMMPMSQTLNPMSGMTVNGMNGMNGQWDPNQYSFMLTLMDVMRHQNLNLMNSQSWSGQPLPSQPLPQSQIQPVPAHQTHAPQQQSFINDAFQPAPEDVDSEEEFISHMNTHNDRPRDRPRSAARKPVSETRSHQSSAKVSKPGSKRKRPAPAGSTSTSTSSRKGKERAVSSASSSARTPDREESLSLEPEPSPQPPTPPTRRKNIIARKQPGEIFLSELGEPLQFFVQVDLQGRHGVVSAIKKNKGKIVNNVNEADYVILFSRSQTFLGLVREAQDADKLVIQPAFVYDCVAEEALLDETEFVLESMVVATPIKKAKKASQTTKPKETKKPKRKAPGRPAKEDIASPKGHPSPSPPPQETRVMTNGGKYLFTDAEIEYFERYAQFLLEQDPTTSATAIGIKMHKKMPHHPLGSWHSQMSGKLRSQLDIIRKKVNIAKRKSMSLLATERPSSPPSISPTEEQPQPQPGPSKKPRLSQPPEPSAEEIEREDFNVICRFFAEGGGDDDDDNRVWAKLAEYRPCRTASSWPEFYRAHEQEVAARAQELYDERQRTGGT